MGIYRTLGIKRGQQFCCPFPHTNEKGEIYYEKTKSAGISAEGKFHCFSCNRSYTNEDWFLASIINTTELKAKFFNKMLKETFEHLPQNWEDAKEDLQRDLKNVKSDNYKYLKELGLLELSHHLVLMNNKIALPVLFYGQTIDYIVFQDGEEPKYRKSSWGLNGVAVFLEGIFDYSKPYVLICAGPKDMLEATKHGFNAITLNGGEGTEPTYIKWLLKDKRVYIAYDNDKVGKEESVNLAEYILKKEYTKKIKILDLSIVLKESKEDITDFFVKYKQTKKDLLNIIKLTPFYESGAPQETKLVRAFQKLKTLVSEIEALIFEKAGEEPKDED